MSWMAKRIGYGNMGNVAKKLRGFEWKCCAMILRICDMQRKVSLKELQQKADVLSLHILGHRKLTMVDGLVDALLVSLGVFNTSRGNSKVTQI
jgi:phosphoglycerate dehydrogenase-like enzyme